MCVPALLGMEYPDPVGSGLSVPVLGCQSDLSGNKTPLAGTMEDPGGKGNKDDDDDHIQSVQVLTIKRIICKSNPTIRCSLYLTGLVAIRYGSQTVDPVTEVLAPVVGARLDVSRRKVVPVTSFYWLLMADQADNIQVGTAVRGCPDSMLDIYSISAKKQSITSLILLLLTGILSLSNIT